MTNFEPCPVCGAKMQLVREKAQLTMGARSAFIDVERYRCDECGENLYTPEQMDTAQQTLVRHLRAQEDLLAPEQIRTIRERRRLTQAQFEQLLGVGPKTVVRWERGTVFQSRSTDDVLRLIESVPGAYDFLAKRHHLVDLLEGPCPVASKAPGETTVLMPLPAPIQSGRAPKVRHIEAFRNRGQEKAVPKEAEASLPMIPTREMR